eukprot:365032-Chlamydomonas_euryale.AAC.1
MGLGLRGQLPVRARAMIISLHACAHPHIHTSTHPLSHQILPSLPQAIEVKNSARGYKIPLIHPLAHPFIHPPIHPSTHPPSHPAEAGLASHQGCVFSPMHSYSGGLFTTLRPRPPPPLSRPPRRDEAPLLSHPHLQTHLDDPPHAPHAGRRALARHCHIHGHASLLLTLPRWDGVLQFNNLILTGIIPAVAKSLIDAWCTRAAAGGWLGRLLSLAWDANVYASTVAGSVVFSE